MSTNKPLPVLVMEMSEVLSKVIDNGGELTPELEALFDAAGVDLKTKTDSYAFFMDRLETEATFWKAKADDYAKVARSCKELRERLNDSIKGAMRMLETDEICGNDMRFKLARAAPKLVIEESKLPPSYLMQVVENVPDKTKIKADIEVGKEIPGVTQEDVYTLRKSINSKRGK